MSNFNPLSGAIRFALLAGAASTFVAMPAFAQDAEEEASRMEDRIERALRNQERVEGKIDNLLRVAERIEASQHFENAARAWRREVREEK